MTDVSLVELARSRKTDRIVDEHLFNRSITNYSHIFITIIIIVGVVVVATVVVLAQAASLVRLQTQAKSTL